MAIKVIYKDIPIGAKENAKFTTTPVENFANTEHLRNGAATGAVATCELNCWGLSHDYKARGTQKFALWSKTISDAEGIFTEIPSIVIDFTNQYTSTGLSFRFSPETNDYCTIIGVKWYQNGAVKETGIFYPDGPVWALENAVEAFDKIEILFGQTNLPHRRLKIEHIAVGIIREFDGRELTGASIMHEVDLISNSLPLNVLDASFHSSNDAEYIFQRKQPVEAYNDDALIGVYYIETGERTSSQNYKITCHDAIGVLELDTYKGNLWLTDTPIETILDDILKGAFTVEIDAALQGATLRGYIQPDITKREALQKVAFALGACVDTSGTANIKLFLPEASGGTEISEKETYRGGTVTTADTVTEVVVVYYDIVNKRPGENDDYIEFNDVQYFYESNNATAKNPNLSTGTLPNKIVFSDCYLCNSTNAAKVANSILAYYMRRNTYSAKHVAHDEGVGNRAIVHMPWGDTQTANIKKMTISVTGITVSDTEFLLD